ncbi:hypothetical protein RUM43_013160 [Polyplax serrata]|uniref:Uncharacterized protein n=1 Tax=Polyplax serrata TaxID=468196 RepID=A0AAN8S789_POLSC
MVWESQADRERKRYPPARAGETFLSNVLNEATYQVGKPNMGIIKTPKKRYFHPHADREKSLELRERPKKGKAQEVELESKWEIKKNPFRADAIFHLQWPDKE